MAYRFVNESRTGRLETLRKSPESLRRNLSLAWSLQVKAVDVIPSLITGFQVTPVINDRDPRRLVDRHRKDPLLDRQRCQPEKGTCRPHLSFLPHPLSYWRLRDRLTLQIIPAGSTDDRLLGTDTRNVQHQRGKLPERGLLLLP